MNGSSPCRNVIPGRNSCLISLGPSFASPSKTLHAADRAAFTSREPFCGRKQNTRRYGHGS